MGEDCLFLNIWTKPQVGEKKKAVMIWLYGGGEYFESIYGHESAH
jgi:cholinesterase